VSAESPSNTSLTPAFFWVGIIIFLLLRSPCKITNPNDNPFWEN
jgi:hypothetical protein